ncbi:MAG: S9 family peptidase [Gemmatimonadetes bacterium]|nr:S9 family peptidase [Gemmatimonadota bacterium]
MRNVAWLVVLAVTQVEAQVPGPSFRQVIDLAAVGAAAISPDGRAIAYTVRGTDWKENRFDTEVWLWRQGDGAIQLTRTAKGSSTSPRWSADGRWLGFLADRGDKQQLYVMRAAGGEAIKVTSLVDGVADFRWSPAGGRIALLALEPESDQVKKLKSLYGEWAIEDTEYRRSHLWVVDADPTRWVGDSASLPKPARLTDAGAGTVSGFAWSPQGDRIAYEHRRDPLVTSASTADISIVTVADRTVIPLINRPGFDGGPVWSPDGQWVAFTTNAGDTTANFFRNNQLMKVPATGGPPTRLATGFDEQIGNLSWTAQGLWFVGFDRTERHVYRVDPDGGDVIPGREGLGFVQGIDFAADGRTAVVTAQANSMTLSELWQVDMLGGEPTRATDLTAQIAGWELGSSEVVSWPSRDGTVIEGVLHKPRDYDPSKRYPLLVVIHGGPTGIDFPQPVPFYVYPIPQWVAKGAVVLRPNYRGSAGYGEAFRSLNVRNLGVGDMWDVMSGVDFLIKEGVADSARMGAMGWSQGGYISAFLTTNTNRFKAISVGAGISNWVTYYVSTDIHPFTRQYLKATPWDDPAIYLKTSPMTTIRRARTPTLIQHGQFDQRVPTQNAYELYQGLQDQGVATELIIYKGFGHGINKPKEQLAAVWHNWSWFGKYLWGEDIPIPVEETADANAGGR